MGTNRRFERHGRRKCCGRTVRNFILGVIYKRLMTLPVLAAALLYVETRSLLPLQYIKVALPFNRKFVFLTAPLPELHANDDGSIPATFQVIYMVGPKCSALLIYIPHFTDRMETGTQPAETARSRHRQSQFEGSPVIPARRRTKNTKMPNSLRSPRPLFCLWHGKPFSIK